jgi:hypothetical protein
MTEVQTRQDKRRPEKKHGRESSKTFSKIHSLTVAYVTGTSAASKHSQKEI